MIEVGVSKIEITPPPGLAMAGFAARNAPATGTHDPLTVRALVVGNTALVTADVIGIEAAMSRRARRRSCLADDAITIAATHTHGAPNSMQGRLWSAADPDFLAALETGIVEAIDKAVASRRPVSIRGGNGRDPGFARNRRHKDGAMDPVIPILRFDGLDGEPVAILISYACHPVVLGADNLLLTGDYVHFAREELEAALPGAVAVFATGCAGDINSGHSAQSSLSAQGNAERTYEMAAHIGREIANAVRTCDLSALNDQYGSAEDRVDLDFLSRETASADVLIDQWTRLAQSDSDTGFIYEIWIDWAKNRMATDIDPLEVRCTALCWGGSMLIGLPGEVFAETALRLRDSIARSNIASEYPVFIMAYSDDNPGYIPPRTEYRFGGYEIDEAHRFYGLGATFAPGSAERLEQTGCLLAKNAAVAAAQNERAINNYTNERGNNG
jgi:hypothetical protein